MPRPPRPKKRRISRVQVGIATVAVAALLTTGVAWQNYSSLQAGIEHVDIAGVGGKEDGATDVLLVGTDSRTDAHGNPLAPNEVAMLHAGDEAGSNNTDTIILIRIPNNGSSATAISIPRDSYIAAGSLGKVKINSVYGSVKEEKRIELVNKGESDSEADSESTSAGRAALVSAVANLTGVTVDRYAEIGLVGFVLLTNAIGGVDVCLNNAVDEPLSGAKFPAGQQTLDGPSALSFVRQRHDLPRGDLDRVVRQQAFMASLVHKVLSAKTLSNPSTLSNLKDAVQRSVVLSSDWDIMKFATQLQDLAGGKVAFSTIPIVTEDGWSDDGSQSVVQVDPPAVQTWVKSLLGDDKSSTTTPSKPAVDPSTITVDVANDSGIDGLASSAAAALTTAGYKQGAVGNNTTASVGYSQVQAADADDPGAKAVAQALGGLPIVTASNLTKNQVRVVLSTDYAGPGAVRTSTTTAATSSTTTTTSEGSSAAAPSKITAGATGPMCVN